MAGIGEEFKNSSSKVSISIQKSVFKSSATDENSFFGKVSRNTVNIDNMIMSICEQNPEFDEYEFKRFAKLLKIELVKTFSSGKSVNFLDLGLLYLALSNGVKGKPRDAADISPLTVKFTPSKELLNSLGNVEIDKIVYADTAPNIKSTECVYEDAKANVFVKGKVLRILGHKLKLDGEHRGLFFCPVDDSGEIVQDESQWTKCDVIRNLPKTLEAYVPDSLSPGRKYAFAVKTRPNAAGIYSYGFSGHVSVAE